MSEDNKNIEEFFRKFSETYPSKITFNEAHWEQMEGMLDEHMPLTGSGSAGNTLDRLSSTVSVVTLLILLVAVRWNWSVQAEVSRAKGQILAGGTEQIVGNLSESQSMADNVEVIEERLQAVVQSEQLDVPEMKSPSDAVVVASSLERQDQVNGSTISRSEDKKEMTAVKDQGRRTSDAIIPIREESGLQQETGSEALPGRLSMDAAESERWDSGEPIDKLMPEVPTSAPNRAVLPIVVLEEDAVKPVAAFPRLAVGLSFSPDLSSNQLGSYNRLGAEFGVVIEYRLHRRWSIEGGVLTTTKRYKVAGYDYSPEEGFWDKATDGNIPHSIDASCHVIDIPINIRYRVLENEVSSLSAAVGLSSYLMLSEDYQYELSYGYDSWGTGHENDHFFSVGNIQVYYERKLGKHFAVEAAPFLKLPLAGYGHGNIKFHSLGMFLNVKRYFRWR